MLPVGITCWVTVKNVLWAKRTGESTTSLCLNDEWVFALLSWSNQGNATIRLLTLDTHGICSLASGGKVSAASILVLSCLSASDVIGRMLLLWTFLDDLNPSWYFVESYSGTMSRGVCGGSFEVTVISKLKAAKIGTWEEGAQG